MNWLVWNLFKCFIMERTRIFKEILVDIRELLQQIVHHTKPLSDHNAFTKRRLHKQEVIDLLGISPRTYDRYKARGLLVPHRMGGQDFYYMDDLESGLAESIRKGKL